jgi:DNA ligase-1
VLFRSGVPQEGTILKSEMGEWKDGKPTWQIKMKLEMDIDLVIVGFNYGTKGTKTENVISSLSCESSDGLLKTRPQGIKEEMMQYITENQDTLLGKIVQVKCNGLSNDKDGNYSLLYPAFMMVRDDKDTCDSLEGIKNIENMVKSLATV